MIRAKVVETVRKGSLLVRVREYADGRYGFDHQNANGVREKIRLQNLEDATARARLIVESATGGMIDPRGIDPALWAEFLRWKADQEKRKKVPGLVADLIQTRKDRGRSFARIRELEGTLLPFAKAFPGYIDALSRSEVEAWLNLRKIGPRRWNNMRETIIALHKFARRDGCLPAQLTPVELIEPREAPVVVETYTPEEFQKLYAVVPHKWKPLLILGAFCGIRPEEICPDRRGDNPKPSLEWRHVMWAKRKVDIPAAISKVRRRRFVPLCDAALAYLKPWRHEKGACVPRVTIYGRTAEWGRKAGVPWKADGLRHSYASYKLALFPNIHELAFEMGNSPKMIHDHYLDLKHEDEAEAWFALRPEFQKFLESARFSPVRPTHTLHIQRRMPRKAQ